MPLIHAAIAILHHHDHFLMQLRDEAHRTSIHPGLWGFFGGHIEPGESPDVAVQRELLEEIGYAPPNLKPFQIYPSERAIRYVFQAPLGVPLSALTLQEGQDLGLVSIDAVRQGEYYSTKLNEVRSLAAPHRAILLEFWEQHTGQSSDA